VATQTSVTAGTIFQDTHKPLTEWFRAMYWVTTQKNGASALGLQRVLELKSYKTAWTWPHKLRRAKATSRQLRLPDCGAFLGPNRGGASHFSD